MTYVAYKNAFFREMQFWSHCYTVVSYQALFRLSVYTIPAVYLSGAKNVCFCTIHDFGSPTICEWLFICFKRFRQWSNFTRIYGLSANDIILIEPNQANHPAQLQTQNTCLVLCELGAFLISYYRLVSKFLCCENMVRDKIAVCF